MAITGTGAVEREQSILFIQINGVWEPIGADNESLERTRNNTVTQTKNVLGRTKTKITKGNQVTSVSPYLIAKDSALAKELYEIDRKDKQLDEVKYRFMEVSIFDQKGDEKFAAWTQEAKVDLKSWGGAAADGLTAPFDIVWEGDRTYGTYDRAANTFTSDGGISTSGFTEKHKPCAWPSPWYGSCPRITTFTSCSGVSANALNISSAGGKI